MGRFLYDTMRILNLSYELPYHLKQKLYSFYVIHILCIFEKISDFLPSFVVRKLMVHNFKPILIKYFMVSGSTVIIEDDEDDKDIILEALKELNIPKKIVWFIRCTEAFSY